MTSRATTHSGIAYVRSRDAARAAHLSPDHVSRLARKGLIDGKLIDGVWHVSAQSLAEYLIAEAQKKDAWRAHLRALRLEEQRRAGHPSAVFA